MQQDPHFTDDLEQLRKKYRLLSEKEKELRVIHDFAVTLIRQETLHEVVWAIARNAIAKLGFVDCVIYLMNETGDALVQAAAHGPKNPQEMDILNPIVIPLGKGIVGTVAQTKSPELIGDTSLDDRYILDDDFRYSEIAVPILDGNRVIGVIDSEHPDKNFFTEQHLRLLTTVAAMATSKILHTRAAEQLQKHQEGLETVITNKTAELRDSITRLQIINEDLESFAYAASHDLAEPLRSIASFLQLIRRNEQNLSASSREYMDYAILGAHRMRDLLDGLLAYSRLGQETTNLSHIHPAVLIEEVRSNLRKLIEDKNASIEYATMLPIQGHETGILQLFQNLIANAIKFHHHLRPPRVRIVQRSRSDSFLFSIEDNGIGMEEVFFNKAFRLFGRLHSIEQYQGSGIGLAICKRIVENHGGEIWIESEPGQGTRVFFTVKK